MEKNREVKLSDFYQSVILKAVGFPLLRLERGKGKFVTFVFDDPEHKAEEVLRGYWAREIRIEARSLIETINELKTRIHAGV